MSNSTTIQIPSDLNGVTRLMTARQWERAAIVWAYVAPQQGKRTSAKTSGSRCSIEDFAALGLSGLRSISTVRMYYRTWDAAIRSGHAQPVNPGDTIAEPDLPWEPVQPVPKPDADVIPISDAVDVDSSPARRSQADTDYQVRFTGEIRPLTVDAGRLANLMKDPLFPKNAAALADSTLSQIRETIRTLQSVERALAKVAS
ncbi:hypothetical protein [Mycolicibacterium porcinum]|uniref:hypothetical protein n=1 Tax=Mycolicibacterium porcinum TaxID=39693 RepID=UPI00084939BB|nr:hypothetical protein [Mycolicibacterium porcinum]ODR23056.1 hypothetical protein BHQ19_18350 [Mycolicibacterium porcinum]